MTLTVADEAGDEGEDADEDRRLQAGGDLRRTPDKGKKHDARTVAGLCRGEDSASLRFADLAAAGARLFVKPVL